MMKRTILFLALITFFPFYSISQGCLPDGITFTSQEQIDSFPSDYPGCTEIEGDVTITGNDIINLDSLYPIVSIENGLSIVECDKLSSISGLSNLQNLYDLEINKANSLKSLSGLEGINSVNYCSIVYTDSLSSLNGLDNLRNINDRFALYQNNSLVDISALANLDTISRAFIAFNHRLKNLNDLQNVKYCYGDLHIEQNDSLVDAIFNNLVYSGDLRIDNNAMLENISFPNLISVSQDLTIIDNPQLSDLGNFSVLNSVPFLNVSGNTNLNNINAISDNNCVIKGIRIVGNDNLLSIIGFNNTGTINRLTIGDNMSLQSVSGFNFADTISDFEISGNNSLTDILGFNNLIYVGNSIEVENNASLVNLSVFPLLYKIGGSLILLDNNMLSTITKFNSLERIGGHFDIKSCNSLLNFDAFNQLSFIGGDMNFENNGSLTNFVGLENISKANGDLIILNNNSLINMNGLGSLTLIEGRFQVVDNDSLINLEGLENLEKVNRSISISNSISLVSLKGLNTLSAVNFGVLISNCDELINFSGLENLTTINGMLFVWNNSKLRNFEGLDKLFKVSDRFDIYGNPSLVNFTGLKKLYSVGKIHINNNENLQNLGGFEKLVYVTNAMIIIDNSSIKNLNGIENINQIFVRVRISGNDSLVSLEGLENAELPMDIQIYSNPFLSFCNTGSICDFLSENPSIYISCHGNAPGCMDRDEITEACALAGNYDPLVFPLRSTMPHWNVLNLDVSLPNEALTQSYFYGYDTIFCGHEYSKLQFYELGMGAYFRSDHKQAFYRTDVNCTGKEYLLYDYSLSIGDSVVVGWNSWNNEETKDTAIFVLNRIDTVNQFGENRRRFHMEFAESNQSFTGSLKWVEGIGSEVHPFYPFALLDEELMHDYTLLCFDSAGTQFYQSPFWNTCDTNYTPVEEMGLANSILISPNPFQTQLTIDSPNEKILQIKVYSITGKLVKDIAPANNQAVILTLNQDIPQGIYLVQIFTENKMVQRKIMKL